MAEEKRDLQTLMHSNRPKSAQGREIQQETQIGITQYRSASALPMFTGGGPIDEKPTPTTETSPLLGISDGSTSVYSEDGERIDWNYLKSYFRKENYRTILRHLKVAVLIIIATLCCIVIMINEEHKETWHQVAVDQRITSIDISGADSKVKVQVKGPVKASSPSPNTTAVNYTQVVIITLVDSEGYSETEDENSWELSLDQNLLDSEETNDEEHEFESQVDEEGKLVFTTNGNVTVPLSWRARELPSIHIVYAALVLAFVYGMIIFELVHRTVAAMLGALAAIAILASAGERPTIPVIISWLDMDTLMLLFGMMILVSVFSETGFFDSFALQAYKLAKGRVWPLITLLCVFSAVVSAFLDNVTTILLLTPVTIRLCEVLNLDPKNILIAEVLFSNIGGTATAIGDPPNVIIVSDSDMKDLGIDFANFTLHMSVGIVAIGFVGYALLRFVYRDMHSLQNQDPPEIAELKHEIELWKRAAARVAVASREESIMKALFLQKSAQRENALIRQLYKLKKTEKKDFRQNVQELERKYFITDRWLLLKSSIVLVAVILCFFLHPFIDSMHIELGWIAIMGAIALIVLADIAELENVLHRVEWATLLFFAALFVLMEALAELQLIDWLGDNIGSWITGVDKDKRLAIAILLLLWASAIISSFIDNIPYTTAMVPVLIKLHEDNPEDLPLLPLTLALAFGACLGGNGTLIGASANVVCAGIADQHGYGFTFIEFFKVGFPMMLVTTTVAMAYLSICHIAGNWNS